MEVTKDKVDELVSQVVDLEPNLEKVKSSLNSNLLLMVDHLTISQFLCLEGTQWKYEPDRPCFLSKSHLTWIGKVRLYFVCGCLIPTKQVSDTTKQNFYIIYIILTGGLFDVKRHIFVMIE